MAVNGGTGGPTGGPSTPGGGPTTPGGDPSTPGGGATGCQVSYGTSSWTGGFTANVTVKNTSSSAVDGWSLAFTLPSGQSITNSWNASLSGSSGAVTAHNMSYNGSIPAGGSQSFGYQGTYTGSFAKPSAFSLNGTACATV